MCYQCSGCGRCLERELRGGGAPVCPCCRKEVPAAAKTCPHCGMFIRPRAGSVAPGRGAGGRAPAGEGCGAAPRPHADSGRGEGPRAPAQPKSARSPRAGAGPSGGAGIPVPAQTKDVQGKEKGAEGIWK